MSKRKVQIGIATLVVVTGVMLYLFLPPRYSHLRPANFDPLSIGPESGKLLPLTLNPKTIYGMGLTYSTHIKETGSSYDLNSPPMIFCKDVLSLGVSDTPVKLPGRKEIISKAENLEPGLGKKLEGQYSSLPLLLDYEVELAFVLLNDVDWSRMSDPAYGPALGYFIANDLSARTLAALGEGKKNKSDYWGASKSFPGFLPVGKQMWVPSHFHPDSLPVTTLTTTVNGQVRQRQVTTDLIYTPKQMLTFIARKYPNRLPQKGDVVLTGTPGGVALQIPYWKIRLGKLLYLDALTKLSFLIRSNRTNDNFIKPGDTVEVSGGVLGTVQTRFID